MRLTHRAVREAKLLSILRRELALSAGLIKRLKYLGAFTVNGERVYTNHPVQPGDWVEVRLDEAEPDYPAQDGALDILYEDEALLAIDKPAGILMHPSAARNTDTLANYLLGYYRQTGQACAVHPVSRLDRDTLGVVLFAKNAHVHAKLFAQHHAGAIEKTYHAAVFGAPPLPEGLIDAPVARVEAGKMLRCIRDDGKPACSAYRILEKADSCARLELHPLTGRTHQLRLHCLHIGCPILGDPQYSTAASAAFSAALGMETQRLCAVSVRFFHPLLEKYVEIRAKQDISLDFLPHADV